MPGRPSAKQLDQERDNFYAQTFQTLATLRLETPGRAWPWREGGPVPRSIESDRPFRAGNAARLGLAAAARLHADERWGTARQIEAAGGRLRAGERGVDIIHWQVEPTAGGEPERLRQVRYEVFNAEQAEWPVPPRADWALDPQPSRPPAPRPQPGADTPEKAVAGLAEPGTLARLHARLPDVTTIEEYNSMALYAIAETAAAPRHAALDRASPRGASRAGWNHERNLLAAWMIAERLGVPYSARHNERSTPPLHALRRISWQTLYTVARDAQAASDYVFDRARRRGQALPARANPLAEHSAWAAEGARQAGLRPDTHPPPAAAPSSPIGEDAAAARPSLVEQARAAMARDREAPSRSR